MEKAVFISHSSDDKLISEQICSEIEKNGIGCWIAPRDVVGGMPYAEEIVRAIKEAKIVLLVASVSINKSEQILNEIEIAVNQSKIILPFKIDPVDYNDSYKYYLNRKHWIEALPDPNDYYAELINTIDYLLSKKDCQTDTADDRYLIALAEKNRKELIKQTAEKRLSFGLSIETDEYADKSHYYDYIKRVDVIDSQTGKYSSYRWLTITNKSDKPTTWLLHKECGENKVNFSDMRLRAKDVTEGADEVLSADGLTQVQPNFVQLFKIYFKKALLPGQTMRIFYRLDWPGEASSYYGGELSTSISLTRYSKGVGRLTFGILHTDELCGFELKEVRSNFEQSDSSVPPTIMSVSDDEDLQPLHSRRLGGAYFEVEDAADAVSYRIIYKKADKGAVADAEEDF